MPIHSVLLPDGRVLTYGSTATGQQTGYFQYDVWDPGQGMAAGHMVLPNGTGTDTFCNAQLLLPQGTGEVLLAGGDNWTGTNTTNTGNANTLLFKTSDRSLTRSLDMFRPRWYATLTSMPNGEVFVQGGRNGEDRAEVRKTDGTYRLLDNIDTTLLHWYYPRNWVAPDGRVFGFDTYGQMYYVDITGNGALTNAGRLALENRGQDASAAMFLPGKILQFGGNSNGAVVINITSGNPVVTPTSPMSSQRRWGSATILANGSVLVGGGGAPGPMINVNAEIYFPPYLFTANGALAPRPRIVSAPDLLGIGQTFTVEFANASSITRVALLKTGSVTHSFDMDQRYVPLSFTASGNRLTVRMPTRATDATPGYYQLLLVNAAGTPSVAKIVRVPISQ